MLEDDLKALMTGGRDTAFTLGVMARIERRQFRRAMIANIVLALAVTALLALTMPVLQQTWQAAFAPRVNNVTIAVLLLGASWLGMRTFRAG
jgi:FtsH-binding integral membrane protein